MSLLVRSGTIGAVALVLAMSASGCNETVLDATKTEEQITEDVETIKGTKVASVDCPSGIEVEPKTRFSCEVNLANGKTETATLSIRDEDANLSFLDLQPAK